MATQTLDCVGLKCPQPTLKITVLATRMQPGDMLEVLADCPTFEKDTQDWCTRAKRTLLWCKEEVGGIKRILIKL
jgi:tRNA 2-thiouridine synthesizing protein A